MCTAGAMQASPLHSTPHRSRPYAGSTRHQSKTRARDSVGARADDVGKGGPLDSAGE